MKSSPVEVSFDSSSLLDVYHLSALDLLDFANGSPSKKPGNVFNSFEALSPTKTPDLLCGSISNELFQVTNHLRWGDANSLCNDKIDKLVEQFRANNLDMELDAQLRTRVFKNRFRKPEPLDVLLESYLRETTGKNSKVTKHEKIKFENENGINANSFDKENALHAKRKPLHTLRRHKRAKTAIPVLQALPTNTLIKTSPRRVCVPRKQSPGAPARKPLKNLDIYLVDALTGHINDATQFGTELNASNCEGFPMPEDVNEIVQIPTNDSGANLKMALIKAFHSTGVEKGNEGTTSRGFYSKKEFDAYRNGSPRESVYAEKQRVRWADELEW